MVLSIIVHYIIFYVKSNTITAETTIKAATHYRRTSWMETSCQLGLATRVSN